MELGLTCKGGGIPLNRKEGKFSAQFLADFSIRWFGIVLSLDKKEINVEIKKIALKRLQECLSVSTPSTQTTQQTQPQFNRNISIFKVLLCSSISLECLEGVPWVLWGPLGVLGNFGMGMQGLEQLHLCPAKCHLGKVPFGGAGKGRNCLGNKWE